MKRLPQPARKLRAFKACALLCLAGPFVPAAMATPITNPNYPGVTCDTVQMPTRDGTMLTTYLYQPIAAGKYPVIMQRNPYGFLNADGCFTGASAAMATWGQNGYVGIHQETRGTYNSQGVFNPNVQEADDGYDAVEWAAAQPWSNSRVGLTGASYLGLTAWQPAIHKPPHLVAMAPSITTADLHDDWLYDNGVFLPWGSIYWIALTFMPDAIARQGQALGLPQSQITQQISDWTANYQANILTNWVWELPITSLPEFKQLASYYYDWAWNPNYLGYWSKMDTETRWQNVTVPTLNSGAWYDPFQLGTVSNYMGMKKRGGSDLARKGTHLVMAAYGHSGDSGMPTFGNDTFDPTYQQRFFDYYVKGVANGFDSEPAVNMYVLVPPNAGETGSGFWTTATDYPVPGTTYVPWYFSSNGAANSRLGSGTLTQDQSQVVATADHFTYDPSDPVPTTGGNYLNGGPTLLEAGAAEQSTVELRNDILVYTGPVLTQDVPAVGPLQAQFWATSSARDTDFTVKLVDVRPDGLTENVLDRVVRARFRNGDKRAPEFIEPGKAYQYTLDMGNIGIIFPAGHQIRVEVSSSNFPRLSRNLNTAVPNQYDSANFIVAKQTLLHDAAHPSFLLLPVAPGIVAPGH